MENPNLLASQRSAVVATIDPDAYTAADYSSDFVDMRAFGAIQAIVMAGALGTNATLSARLEESPYNNGSNLSNITGKAITPLLENGTDSDKQAIINCRADELDVNNGSRYVRLTMTVATATSDAGAIVMGHDARQGPASDNDLASVDEIVA